MRKKLQLSIPTPCHEDWDKMTTVEKGKFCDSCQKKVIDFSNMNDREIAMFFKKKSSGSVCGRFMQDQLQRNIDIPKKRILWVKYLVQFLIPAFLLSCKESLKGKVKVAETKGATESKCTATVGMIMPEIIYETDTVFDSFTGLPDTTGIIMIEEKPDMEDTLADNCKIPLIENQMEIRGVVVDEQNIPISMATIDVSIFSDPIVSDSSGNFSIVLKADQNISPFKIEVSSAGYKTKKIDYIVTDSSLLTIHLEKDVKLLDTAMVAANVYTKGRVVTGAVSVCKTTREISMDNYEREVRSSIKLFPNPVWSGAVVNVQINNAISGKYGIQLFNVSGQLIFSREMLLDKGIEVLSVPLPLTTSGNYFLRMTDKSSKKNYTEKLVIQ